jgi:hypothetical protein
MCWLAASPYREGDGHLAHVCKDQARRYAREGEPGLRRGLLRSPRHHRYPPTDRNEDRSAFGVTNVRIHEVSALANMHGAGRVIEAAER